MLEKVLDKLEMARNQSSYGAEKFEYNRGSVDAYNNAINLVRAEMKDGGWISCKDRLPEEKENPVTMDYFIYPVMVTIDGITDIKYYGFGKGHWWHGPSQMDVYVTHWMDIKPPKKGE